MLWWMLGIFFYGAGTITESIHTLFGYSAANFKAWYILGDLLGGAPLAQGTVHLLVKPKTAMVLSAALTIVIFVSAFLVVFSSSTRLSPTADRKNTRMAIHPRHHTVYQYLRIYIPGRWRDLFSYPLCAGQNTQSQVLGQRTHSYWRPLAWHRRIVCTCRICGSAVRNGISGPLLYLCRLLYHQDKFGGFCPCQPGSCGAGS